MEKAFLKVPSGRSIHNILISNISHINSKGAYSEICLSTGEKHICAKNLRTIFKKLCGSPYFFRTHKSHIVNLNRISQYRPTGCSGIIVMICGTMVPVSKRVKSRFLNAYKAQ